MPSYRQPFDWTPEGHAGRGTLCYSGPYHIPPPQRRRYLSPHYDRLSPEAIGA
jgi:hypothetical protein